MSTRAEPLGADDLGRIAVAGQTLIAPGGVFAAVEITDADLEADVRIRRIDLIRTADGTVVRTLEPGASHPRWFPDGRTLAYLAPGGRSLLACDPQGTEPPRELIATIDLDVRELELRPDGGGVALAGTRPRAPHRLAALAGGPPPERTPAVIDHPWFRSVDGDLLPPAVWELAIGTFDDGRLDTIALPAGLWADRTEEGEGFGLDWFPDGNALAVSLSARWDDDHALPDVHRDLFRVRIEDGTFERLTDDGRVALSPKVSPDGSEVAFLRQRGDPGDTVFLYEVCVLDLDTSRIRSVSDGHDLAFERIGWMPSGRELCVGYLDRARAHVAVLTLEGSLGPIADGCGPGFDIGRDGRLGVVVSDPATPGDPAVLEPPGRPVAITRLDAWLGERTLATTHEITYYSAHPDRLPIHAMVAHPAGVDDPSRLPVVLDLHGGPYASKGWWFDADREFFAGQGYTVVQPNYRGSDGFGQAFLRSSDRRHYPGWYDEPDAPHEMGLDVVGAIDAIGAQGLGDPDRVFLRGISAGALLTTWVLGRTDRFRAAVANSWYPGEWGAPMYGSYQLRRYFDGPPWDPAHTLDHLRRSPIMLVDRVRSPLLLLHGTRDFFTPQLEVETYFHALRGRGLDVVLATFPGETHGIRRHPTSIASSRRMEVEWFRSHDTTGDDA